MQRLGILILLSSIFWGCYHLSPDPDDLRAIPTTNNPLVAPEIQEKTQVAMPY